MVVTANELKTKGVSLLETLLNKRDEVMVSVRGKSKYVVVDIERYSHLRLHRLGGRLEDLYSVSIDLRYRITMAFFIEDQRIVPVNIGTHDATSPHPS